MLVTLIRYARLLATYFVGQGVTQLLKLGIGFLLIRALPKEDYAVFTLVMAIYATSSILVELGVGQVLTALLGSVHGNTRAMGRYLSACRYYRDRMLGVGILVLFLILLFIAPVYGWGGGFWFIVWVCISCSLICQAVVSIYSPILLLDQDLKRVYTLGVESGLFRLSCIGIAYYCGFLNATWAIVIGTLQLFVEARAYCYMTRGKVVYADRSTDIRKEKKELLSQTLPRVPGYTFLAFEGQITIFMMSVLGTASGLAELGALSRLGMLFILLDRMGAMLVGPYMAKLRAADVFRKTAVILSSITVLVLGILTVVYLFPQLLLFILGDGYQSLEYEVFLVVLASCIRTVDVFIFSICSARKYIYSWFAVLDVAPVIAVMALGFSLLDFSQLTNVLYFTIAMVVVRFLSKILIITVGLRREKIDV